MSGEADGEALVGIGCPFLQQRVDLLHCLGVDVRLFRGALAQHGRGLALLRSWTLE